MLAYVFNNVNQMIQELVRGTSNLIVANIYWLAAFKIHVFEASLFQETPNSTIRRFENHFYQEFLIKLNNLQPLGSILKRYSGERPLNFLKNLQ